MFSKFVKLIFIIPAILDLMFLLPQILPPLGWEIVLPPVITVISPIYFIGSFLILVLMYLFLIIHNLLGLFKIKNKFANVIQMVYSQNHRLILTSTILTLSTLIPLLFSMFFPMIYPEIEFLSYTLSMLTIKLFLIVIMVLIVKYLPKSWVTKVLSTSFIGLITGVLMFLMIEVIAEFSPNYYFTFPLDDQKGRYIINYDGDYWLTYYAVQEACISTPTGQPRCTEVLTKMGNTSIIESPMKLDTYIDKPVAVTGEFIKTHGSLWGEEKDDLCIGTGWKKECIQSKGEGIWYASPLKIKSIQLQTN